MISNISKGGDKMINYIEVQRILFQYDETASPSENDYIKRHYSCTQAEMDALRNDFVAVNAALRLGLKIQNWIDYFVVTGEIEDDIVLMFEDILGRYCNDEYDKVNYWFKEL